MASIRKARFAGSWYPGDGAYLKNAIDEYIKSAEAEFSPCSSSASRPFPRGLIVPHAGYVYSGQTAAGAFAQIKGCRYKTVVVMAPSHRVPFSGAAIWPSGGFSTPLGQISVDEDFATELMKNTSVVLDYSEPHVNEHSLEMELPFLQHILGGFSLVPIVVGGISSDTVSALAMALDTTIGSRKDVLVVASTDLSHFHPAKTAERLDGKAVELMKQMDSDGLLQAEMKGECELCGLMPVATLLAMQSMSQLECTIISYTHSGNITGDNSSVVGYVSAVIG